MTFSDPGLATGVPGVGANGRNPARHICYRASVFGDFTTVAVGRRNFASQT